MRKTEAIVVGAGPNGLCAAIELARAGWAVQVYERNTAIGGGVRSCESTLPGFIHDHCSTIFAMAVHSPMMRSLPLAEHGVQWITPPAPCVHPLDDEPAVVIHRSVDQTAESLGPDADAYRRLFQPLAEQLDALAADILAPLHWPAHPIAMTRFGRLGIQSANRLAHHRFRTSRAQALIAGMAAHSMLPLDKSPTAAFALVLIGCAHAGGWPIVQGGAQHLAEALGSILRSQGGRIITDHAIARLDQLPSVQATLLDVTPRQFVALAGDRLPSRRRRKWGRYRYGPGAFKVDYALSAPIPWSDPACRSAATVHLGGTFDQIADSERAVCEDRLSDHPFVILTQPTLFDPTRAPAGKQIAWAYCHVPHGSSVDALPALERQIERFAPGFSDIILARHTSGPDALEADNPNLVGGDINGGVQDLWQLFRRPVSAVRPYATDLPGVYLCSSSTPPGGGVHGMCGQWAARAVLRRKG